MTKSNKSNINDLSMTADGTIKPPKKEPTDLCNGRLRHESKYCARPAGQGTDHEGTGRCRMHGGQGSGRPKKTMLSSEIYNGTQEISNDLLKKFESLSVDDPTSLANLDREIEVLRMVFHQYMHKCMANKSLPHPGDLEKFFRSLGRAIELRDKVEKKATPKTVNTKIIILCINKMNDILRNRIHDPELLDQIARDMESLSIPELNDGRE